VTRLLEIEKGLLSADPEERRRATALLVEQKVEGVVPLLLRALGDEDWRVRKEATSAATSMAPAPELLKALVRVLDPGDNVGLRNAAVEALAGHGVSAVEAIAQALPQLDADGKKLAAEALGRSGTPQALTALRSLLVDPDPNVRAAAVEHIAMLGAASLDAVMPVLESCLDESDRFLTLAALDGLNQLGVVLRWERLEPLLKDPILQRASVLAVGRSAHEKAALALAKALENGRGALWETALMALVDYVRASERTRNQARVALQGMSLPAQKRLLAAAQPGGSIDARRCALVVIGALGTTDAALIAADALAEDMVAAEAEEALTMLGPIGESALIERARDGAAEQRAVCIELLGRLGAALRGAPLVDALHNALEDESDDVVRAALDALSAAGDERSLRAAAARLGAGEAPAVRKSAAKALAAIACRHTDAARQLAREARPDRPEALAAAAIIGALGTRVRGSIEEDVGFLSAVLASETSLVRRTALESLASIGSALGVEAVAFALTDEEREVQLAAVRALGRLRASDGSAAGIAQLLELVGRSEEDEELAAAAVRALGDAMDPRALGVLRPIARTGTPMVAVAAVEALATMGDPRRIDSLTAALSHPDPEVVKAALRAIAGERDVRVAAHIGACLDHQAWDVRRLAADLLGQTGGETAIELLRAKLANEAEPLVKDAVHRALIEIEGGSAVRRTAPPPRPGSWPPR
jgi:HEAT repeat protein